MIGVFLIGFGAPQNLDELGSFIEGITGRRPPEQAVKAARKRYELIGGKSPLLEITGKQAAALEKSLRKDGLDARVYVAMRHSPPTISEAISKVISNGIENSVVITLAPQFSKMSAGKYLELFDNAYNEEGASFEVNKVNSYGNHPLFLDAVAEMIRRGAACSAPATPIKKTPVIFSAHSLPCGGGFETRPYIEELKSGIEKIKANLGLEKSYLAFQSKGGGAFEWLGPSLEEVMEKVAEEGEKTVIVSPIGFVSDHVETLFDLDIHAKEKAESMGLEFVRAPSLNDSPEFIKLLTTLVRENLQ